MKLTAAEFFERLLEIDPLFVISFCNNTRLSLVSTKYGNWYLSNISDGGMLDCIIALTAFKYNAIDSENK